MTRWTRHLPPLTLIALSAAYLWIATGFKPAAATMPLIAGGAVLLLALAELFRPTQAEHTPRFGRPEAIAITGLIALVGGIFLLGILPACALAMPLALRFGARRSWPAALATSAGLVLVLWLMFAWGLGLDLPTGLLFDGADT